MEPNKTRPEAIVPVNWVKTGGIFKREKVILLPEGDVWIPLGGCF